MTSFVRTPAGKWLRRYHASSDDPTCRLLLLPHAGGSASYFYGFAQLLAGDIDVLTVQYPGRMERHAEPLVGDIEELARQLTTALVEHELTDLPLAFFGHSMGSLIGYETASLLAGKAHPARHLFASSCRAPGTLHGTAAVRTTDDTIIADLKSLGGTDAALLDDPGMRELLLPILRSDSRAVELYRERPRTPLRLPVTAIHGTDDHWVDLPAAQAWAEVSTGPFELHRMPGGHFYFSDPGHQAQVADLVRSRLLDVRPTT
ncbi:alpha/beta fold hydrolase [Micromonospora sp. WMMD714]|uniref:thioesterase II family protein n=1 Tax=Micromonospora sp. WMMD714 TaxID=3016097 RepID=UPI00249B18F0|nr:alpha/beta fold hydrolase [Micromonospora sp. WMMD714]WFE63038.1 alpha/beta fold hydrolase [Micromonospora sp. WMMD714]